MAHVYEKTPGHPLKGLSREKTLPWSNKFTFWSTLMDSWGNFGDVRDWVDLLASLCSPFKYSTIRLKSQQLPNLGCNQAAWSGLFFSIACSFSLLAFQRSTARCAFNQNYGVFPNSLDSLKAMAGDTARRFNNSSFTVWRETPNFSARSVGVRL